MKKTTAGRKVNRAKRKFLCYFLLAAVTLTATGSVWEASGETVQAAPSIGELQNNIKDTSNRGIYHNKRFKALAEERGLQISRHETYGWTITEPTEKTLDFCIINQLEDIQIVRQTAYSIGISGGKAGSGSTPVARPKKPSSTRKYICPCCGNSFRATKTLRVLCMDCNVQFEEVR